MPFLAGAAQFVVRGNEAKAMTSCASASSFKCWLALVLLLIVSLNQSQSQQSHQIKNPSARLIAPHRGCRGGGQCNRTSKHQGSEEQVDWLMLRICATGLAAGTKFP